MDILTPYTIPFEFDLPTWARWFLTMVYLLFDGAVIAKFTKWSLVNGLRVLFRWTMNKFIEQVADKTAPIAAKIVADSFRKSMEEMASEQNSKLEAMVSEHHSNLEKMTSEQLLKLDQMISERLVELNPEPPPHGITGTPCPKDGLYRVQGGGLYVIERTFEEGEIFPPAPTHFEKIAGRPLGMNEQKVVWVYQAPKNEE